MIGGDEGVAEAKRNQSAMLRAGLQLAFRLQDGDAGPFGSHQRPGNVEAVFRQQLVQVVAGDAPRNIREARPHQVRVGVAEAAQARIDLAAAPSAGDDGAQLILGGSANPHAGSVVKQNIERLDIVDGLAAEQGMDAAGVVADHTSQRAAAMGCRVGRKGKLMPLGFHAQRVKQDAGLDTGKALGGIEFNHRIHIFREINDYSDVARLTGQAGSAAAREYRRAKLAACSNRRDHVVNAPWAGPARWEPGGSSTNPWRRARATHRRSELRLGRCSEPGLQFARSGKRFVRMLALLRWRAVKNRKWRHRRHDLLPPIQNDLAGLAGLHRLEARLVVAPRQPVRNHGRTHPDPIPAAPSSCTRSRTSRGRRCRAASAG